MDLQNKYCKASEDNFYKLIELGIKLADDIFPMGNFIFIENNFMIIEDETYRGSLDEEIYLKDGIFVLKS